MFASSENMHEISYSCCLLEKVFYLVFLLSSKQIVRGIPSSERSRAFYFVFNCCCLYLI